MSAVAALPDLPPGVTVRSTSPLDFVCAAVQPLDRDWHLATRAGGTLVAHELVREEEPLTTRSGVVYYPSALMAGFRFALEPGHPLTSVLLALGHHHLFLEVWTGLGEKFAHYAWATRGWRQESDGNVVADAFLTERLPIDGRHFGYVEVGVELPGWAAA